MPVKDVTTKQFNTIVKNATKPVLVDFWAPWCGPCRAFAPTLKAVSEELQASIEVLRCNLDKEKSLAPRFHITSIPTLIIFKNGKPIHTIVGTISKRNLIKELNRFI